MRLRPAQPADFPAVLALNAESVHFLSPLDEARLAELHAEAAVHWVVEHNGHVIAFLLAFREDAAYDSVNYQFFVQRYPTFLYVDRIVVSQTTQARGTGSILYQGVFAFAAGHGIPIVTCEIDVDPPTPVSERFHAKFGFREVGRQAVAGGTKQVALQVADVAART